MSLHVPETDTWPYIYTPHVAFVGISRLCTLMCATCSYEIMAAQMLKLLIIPFPSFPFAQTLLYGSTSMVLRKKREGLVQPAEMIWLRGAKECAL